jgi:hypothetical protein
MLFYVAQCVSVYWVFTLLLQVASAMCERNEDDRARDGHGQRVESAVCSQWSCPIQPVRNLAGAIRTSWCPTAR